jgi:hypothetical protein
MHPEDVEHTLALLLAATSARRSWSSSPTATAIATDPGAG